jgi:S1-C subfamily serine protease
VIVVGYPLGGLLGSGPQVTTGNVSSLIGPGDDTRALQFTAPTQSGNSGGPLLDSDGAVVGVVSSKLNAVRVHEMTGDVPQNVNFAIKAALARGFLDAVGMEYRSRASGNTRAACGHCRRGPRFRPENRVPGVVATTEVQRRTDSVVTRERGLTACNRACRVWVISSPIRSRNRVPTPG